MDFGVVLITILLCKIIYNFKERNFRCANVMVIIMEQKNIVFLGDSITMGYGLPDPRKRFSTLFCEKIGYAENNYGITGTLIAKAGPSRANGSSFLDRYPAMTDNGNLIVVFGGVNDYFWSDEPITGNLQDDRYFSCAVRHLCSGLKEKYPGRPILFLLPYRQRGIGNFAGGADGMEYSFHNTDTKNYVGSTMEEYVLVLEQICRETGIFTLDLFRNFGIDIAHIDEDFKTYTLDGCHPNENGHLRIAEILSEFCRKNRLI